jgi:hypothetical protein
VGISDFGLLVPFGRLGSVAASASSLNYRAQINFLIARTGNQLRFETSPLLLVFPSSWFEGDFPWLLAVAAIGSFRKSGQRHSFKADFNPN